LAVSPFDVSHLTVMQIGSTLDRYEILSQLGRGSMGVVYRAHDPAIDRTVAIKLIAVAAQDGEDEQEYHKRFALEAKAAGRLLHPGIVAIFDVGEEPESGDPYLVMEYVPGQSLGQLIASKERKISMQSALKLTQELAEALQYAHTQGVIHRDIKPANILVTEDFHPKIADFGIARLNQAQMTLPGRVIGSPAYMAPEQLNGEGLDARSDLFSLGVVLYFLLTGYAPFQGNSATTVCFKVANREPMPASAYNPQFPPEVDRLLARAMAKNPEERYQTGAEMAADIQILRERTVGLREFVSLPPVTDAIPFIGRAFTAVSAAMNSHPASVIPVGPVVPKERAEPKRWNPGLAYVVAGFVLVSGAALYLGFHSHLRKTHLPSAKTEVIAAPLPETIRPTEEPTAVVVTSAPGILPAIPSRPKPKAKLIFHASVKEMPKAEPKQEPVPPEMADVQVEIEHPFTEATAWIWIDNELVYKHALHGEQTRHALVLHQVRGLEYSKLRFPVGTHQIHVRVESGDAYDQSKTISQDFDSGKETTLHIRCNKRSKDLAVTLN
jgi:serine/threonine protein kinase